MRKKVIFIGGSSYSGSTILDMMLSTGTRGFSTGEVVAMFYPYRPHHLNPSCGCGDESCTLWSTLRHKGAANLYQEIFYRFPDVDYIVDSSKDPYWIEMQSRMLTKQGIDVSHVLIAKTPTEFAKSRLKRGLAKDWGKDWVAYHRLYFSKVNDWISVRYSDLAKRPGETLRIVCESADIEYFSGMERYWEDIHHTLFGNDSAKIHLYAPESESFNKCHDKMTETITGPMATSEAHRTIYFEAVDSEQVATEVTANKPDENLTNVICELQAHTQAGLSPDPVQVARLRQSIVLPRVNSALLDVRNYYKKRKNLLYAWRRRATV